MKPWNVSPNETVFVLLSQAVSLGNILALGYLGNWGQGTADLKVRQVIDWNPVWKRESISPFTVPINVIETLCLVSLQSEETSAGTRTDLTLLLNQRAHSASQDESPRQRLHTQRMLGAFIVSCLNLKHWSWAAQKGRKGSLGDTRDIVTNAQRVWS